MNKALVNNHFKDIMTFLKEDYETYKNKEVEPKCPYCSNALYIYGRSSLKRNCRNYVADAQKNSYNFIK